MNFYIVVAKEINLIIYISNNQYNIIQVQYYGVHIHFEINMYGITLLFKYLFEYFII